MRLRSVIAVVATTLVLGSLAYFVYRPLIQASRIRLGDTAGRVHRLLGKPDAVFDNTGELWSSYLGPGSYVFTDKEGNSGIALQDLPRVTNRAEWFAYASAGHLVYYDANGVVAVFWGGT